MTKSFYEFLTESVGWIGVVLIVAAYAMLSFGLLEAEGYWFQGLNFFGAIGIVVDAVADKNYQPAVLNMIWAVIALVALARILW